MVDRKEALLCHPIPIIFTALLVSSDDKIFCFRTQPSIQLKFAHLDRNEFRTARSKRELYKTFNLFGFQT